MDIITLPMLSIEDKNPTIEDSQPQPDLEAEDTPPKDKKLTS